MPKNQKEQRREERVRAALPVDLGGVSGVTRDISATGIFFETVASYAVANPLSMAIDIDTPGGPITMNYLGKVVRLERRDNRLGVAVRILESTVRPAIGISSSPP